MSARGISWADPRFVVETGPQNSRKNFLKKSLKLYQINITYIWKAGRGLPLDSPLEWGRGACSGQWTLCIVINLKSTDKRLTKIAYLMYCATFSNGFRLKVKGFKISPAICWKS